MSRTAIIDYGLCNLDSIKRAAELCGADAAITSDPDHLKTANHLILPGVGAFGVAMENLRAQGLDQAIQEQVRAGVPLLGICLGMQLLASRSEEGGDFSGLGLIPGDVVVLREQRDDERIPHIGWNSVTAERDDDPLLATVPLGSDFYFVHSYHFRCAQKEHIAASTPYCGGFSSVVRHEQVVGTQFHPEKSQRAGFRVLENFLR